MSDDTRMCDAFSEAVVDMTQSFRVVFHVAMANAKTDHDRSYINAATAHFAACILAVAWSPQQDRAEFKDIIMQSLPRLLDGGMDSIEKMRVMDAEVLSKVLRDAGKMQ